MLEKVLKESKNKPFLADVFYYLPNTENQPLSPQTRGISFLMPFFVAVANRVLTVLSVASLGKSVPSGRARIPLSPQTRGISFF